MVTSSIDAGLDAGIVLIPNLRNKRYDLFPPSTYTLDLMSSNNALSFSMSVFCCGQSMPRPSVSLGLGICFHPR